jgi:uncharacterized integral membrane protein
MPVKLIGFIIFIFLIFAFIGFNLENHTNINLWVNEKGHFEDVSIIIVVFSAYLFGLLSTVPFWFSRSMKRRKEKKKSSDKTQVSDKSPLLSESSDRQTKPEKKTLFRKKKRTLEERNS